MHSKTLNVLFLSALAAAAAVEERQYGGSDSGDDYYNSLMSELNSLATNTDYMDYLTAYSDLPTDYSAYLPSATGSGSDGGSNSESNNYPAVTAAPSVSIPSGLGYDMPPPSIESVLATAIPPSYLSQLANPTAASSIISEIQHGHYPSWYQDLPSSVKAWITSHYMTGSTAAATGGSSGSSGNSGSGSAAHGNAASTGVLATGFMGAAAILAIAVML
ncbi:uncharacterized protein N7496_011472 [Penicillium cataractarum]|uniref:Uncharacterized protein n=1 Tax=Penicillium cataractarum TaxID=2100454 RepID=A0A9W9RHQ0_9EURO|nr:uncharacterized protein N7496_011472 [Penicillium cataractarum]KAJ5359059.1 hypothetical protein N7496_011472 [Penicillium cataractarum]